MKGNISGEVTVSGPRTRCCPRCCAEQERAGLDQQSPWVKKTAGLVQGFREHRVQGLTDL